MQTSQAVAFPGGGTWPECGPYDVFVYGTLKPGGHYWHAYVKGKAIASMPSMVRGRLYHLPARGYPALSIEATGNTVADPPLPWVHGFLHRFEALDDVLALDALEGYDPTRHPSQNEYQRRFVPVFDSRGEPFATAWTYVMSAGQITEYSGRLVSSGDWPVANQFIE